MKISHKTLIDNSKESFKKIKNLSEKYQTWNDVQKSNEKFKSSVWKAIKNFRKSENNDKAYKFKKLNGKISCFGWLTLTNDFTLLF